MCFPVRFLKCVVGFNAWVTILLGLVAIITGLAIQFNKGGESLDLLSDEAGLSRQSFIDSFYVFGVALILFGVFGIIGGKKRNAFCLFLFNIFVLLAFLAFLSIGAASLVVTQKTGGSTQSDCKNQVWSKSIQDNVADDADSTFCRTACGCYIDPNSFTLAQQGILLLQGYKFSVLNTTYGEVTQYDQCPSVDLGPLQSSDYNTLKALETTYDCAGWCQQSPIYQYSNINRGPPSAKSCYYEVNQSIHRYGNTLGGISLAIAFIMFLTMLFSFCLCGHPDQKNQATNYYQRMAYYDQ